MGNKWNDQWWSLVKSQQKKGTSAMDDNTTVYAIGSLEWAIAQCKRWNWNVNAAEIAKELIDADIEHGSKELQNVKRAYMKFFAQGADEDQAWKFIEQAVEVFGG
jgi:hypothetical protein